jgi:hypothetical protein
MDDDTRQYLILIDIKHSTRLPPARAGDVMRRLERELAVLNTEFEAALAVGLTVSYGDEVAGLLQSPIHLYDIVSRVREALYPDALIRVVVVRGAVGAPTSDIRKTGGKVFKLASKAMERLKKKRQYWFCSWEIDDRVLDVALTSLTELTNVLIAGMSAYQREVFVLLRRGLSQKEIARRLGKLPQSVSDAAMRGRAEAVLDGERAIRELLLQMVEK